MAWPLQADSGSENGGLWRCATHCIVSRETCFEWSSFQSVYVHVSCPFALHYIFPSVAMFFLIAFLGFSFFYNFFGVFIKIPSTMYRKTLI